MQPIEVAAGLVFKNGKVLITQRYPDAHQGGLWEFPGGKREPGETFAACLQRELHEELAIQVTVAEEVETIRHEYPDKTVILKFIRCAWKANDPQNLGCAAFRWITLDQLDRYHFPAADARLLNTLRRRPDLWA